MTSPTPTPKLPPNRFCLIPNPFRPGGEFVPTPGLQDSVEELIRQRKLRSAMGQIFAILDYDPDNRQALGLAMVIFGALGKTEMLNAEEALTDRYLYDSRLDSVFAVCSACRRSSWVPDECLFGFQKIMVQNPIGLQCQECGYVMCRKCLEQTPSQSSGTTFTCLMCRHIGNGKPVYPTGRLTRQLKRFGAPVQLVVLFREGPIPPSEDYARKLLDKWNPDPLSLGAEVIALPVEPWSEAVSSRGFSMLDDLAKNGRLRADTFEKNGGIVTDDDGLRVAIFRALDFPPENLLDLRIAALKRELTSQPSSAARLLQELMAAHFERVSTQHRPQPNYRRSAPLWTRLISPPVLAPTIAALLEALPRAHQTGQHSWIVLRLGELFIILSAIPAAERAPA